MTAVKRAVFVHGSGRAGNAAWPNQARAGLATEELFLTRPGFGDGEPAVVTDFANEARWVVDACADGAHVVAFSYGGVPALLAAAAAPQSVLSLALVEPAVFSLGRGLPGIEAHIGALEPVFRRASEVGAAEFMVEFLTAFGVPDPAAPSTPEAVAAAERIRLQRPPWEASLDGAIIGKVPTLVVTGNWNPEYEEMAARLMELGASHRHLEGFGHSAQESPAFNDVLREFWASL